MIGSFLQLLFCRSSADGAPACPAICKSGEARAPVPNGAGAYAYMRFRLTSRSMTLDDLELP